MGAMMMIPNLAKRIFGAKTSLTLLQAEAAEKERVAHKARPLNKAVYADVQRKEHLRQPRTSQLEFDKCTFKPQVNKRYLPFQHMQLCLGTSPCDITCQAPCSFKSFSFLAKIDSLFCIGKGGLTIHM